MKVRVVEQLCQGHALCKMACPEVFILNEDDGHAYVETEDVPPGLEERVEWAQRGCPEGAIEIS